MTKPIRRDPKKDIKNRPKHADEIVQSTVVANKREIPGKKGVVQSTVVAAKDKT